MSPENSVPVVKESVGPPLPPPVSKLIPNEPSPKRVVSSSEASTNSEKVKKTVGPPPEPPVSNILSEVPAGKNVDGESQERVETGYTATIAELKQVIEALKAENKALKAGEDVSTEDNELKDYSREDVIEPAEAITKQASPTSPPPYTGPPTTLPEYKGESPLWKAATTSNSLEAGPGYRPVREGEDVRPFREDEDDEELSGGMAHEPYRMVITEKPAPPAPTEDPNPTTPTTPSEPSPSETPATPPSEPGPVDPGPVKPPAPSEPSPGNEPSTEDEDSETPPPPPPTSPEDLEPPDGGEPFDTAVDAFNAEAEALENAIRDFAVARVSSEKMFSGGAEKTQLDLRAKELHARFEEWSDSLAEVVDKKDIELDQWGTTADQYITQSSDKLADLIAMRSLPQVQIPPMLEAEIKEHEVYLASMVTYKTELAAEKATLSEKSKIASEKAIADKLIDVRTNVDVEMLKERKKNNPQLSKVTDWLKKHGSKRVLLSAGLAGLSMIGVATLNPPLVGFSIAARAALRGIGGYNAVRAGGEYLVKRDLAKNGEDTSIEDYTESAIKGSTTRRRSKRGGLVAGAALAAAPIVANAVFDGPGPPKPPTPEPPTGDPDWTPLPPDPPVPPTEIPFTGADNSYPWDHFKGLVGAGEATPKILQIADKATSMGWQVVGEGGGGTGKIISMTSPGGIVYTGNAAINAALDGINATP